MDIFSYICSHIKLYIFLNNQQQVYETLITQDPEVYALKLTL